MADRVIISKVRLIQDGIKIRTGGGNCVCWDIFCGTKRDNLDMLSELHAQQGCHVRG